MSTAVTEIAPREWTRLDTCDACGQYAKIAVTINDSELLFCWHHEKKYGPIFDEKGWAVSDNPHWTAD